MTLITFNLVNSPDRPELLRGGLSINNCINRDKLLYKCYTCNKIGHLTKNCKLKEKLCPKSNNTNCSGTCPKALWKCTNCNGNHSAACKGCPSIKAVISKSMERRQNLSYAQAVCGRKAKEEIEAFKTNVLININHLTRIITKVLWEINKDDFNTIEQLGSKISTIVKETVNSSSGKKMASLSTSFKSSKLKLAHINIRSCRNRG